VNSKEELIEEDAALHPRQLNPTLKELSSRTRVFSSARIRDIVVALGDKSKSEFALEAMKNARCSEPLCCYLAIMDMEAMDEGAEKDDAKQKIYSRFVAEGHDALCLTETVRSKLLSAANDPNLQAEGIEEIKKQALNDLRFNSVLLKALGTS
jgi:hypothetical protein